MGNARSSETEIAVPWRKPTNLEWNEQFEEKLIDDIKKILSRMKVKPVILLTGQIGAGKSSLVNTFFSAGADRFIRKAGNGRDVTSFTTKFTRYNSVQKLDGYQVCDTMGISPFENKGLRGDDLQLSMKGHIRAGYEYNEISCISENDDHFIRRPDVMDRSHCLAIVFPANKVPVEQNEYTAKIKNAILMARSQDIPTVVILTWIDQHSVAVQKDVSKVFDCKIIEQCVRDLSALFGIPEMFIYPVKNYSLYTEKETCTDILSLLALKKILEIIFDKMEGAVRKEDRANGMKRLCCFK